MSQRRFGQYQTHAGLSRSLFRRKQCHARSRRTFLRGAALVLSVLAVMFAVGCRERQHGGPRRVAGKETTGQQRRPPSSCDQLTCVAPARCELADGVPTCACPRGYEGEPQACQDIDECANAASHGCDANASCVNRAGDYECVCREGFSGDGRSCVTLNDCGAAANSCHPDALCTTGDKGVSCSCSTGFQGDGNSCRDIDECTSGAASCVEHASCRNLRKSYDCQCDEGFGGDGRVRCRSACELALNDASLCDAAGHGRCTQTPAAAASCTSCLPGYVGDGKRCVADGECAALACGPNSVCTGEVGARRCACAAGFEGDPKSSAGCDNIDECVAADACGASSECHDLPGGYMCSCKPGFERVDGMCVNIDECARGLHVCDAAASCTDRSPGYDCACKPGYAGDGFACADIDECAQGDVCPKTGNVTCQNQRGGYACVCPPGYAGAAGGDGCYCDLSGYWATRRDAMFTFPERTVGGVRLLDKTMTRVTFWQLHRFRYDGAQIAIESQHCGTDVAPEVYSPLYEEVYASSIPIATYDKLALTPVPSVQLAKTEALPAHSFRTREVIVQGIQLDDPFDGPWPKTFRDVPESAWVDTDGDGEPGITFWPLTTTTRTLRGTDETYDYLPVGIEDSKSLIDTRASCVSVGIRSVAELQVKIESCGRLTGSLLNGRTEGRIHSCALLREAEWDGLDVTCSAKDWSDARKCKDEHVGFLDEQDQSNELTGEFEMLKLGGLDAINVGCPTVRDKLPALPRR